jgi:hypothetical protein
MRNCIHKFAIPAFIMATMAVFGAEPAPTARRGDIAVPTDAEIAAFKTKWEDGKTTYNFSGGFEPRSLGWKDRIRAAQSGRIPFRVTAYFEKSMMVGARMRSSLMDGTAFIVILNEAGEVVVSRRENLLKLCPS